MEDKDCRKQIQCRESQEGDYEHCSMQAREENIKLATEKRCCFTCAGEPGSKSGGPEQVKGRMQGTLLVVQPLSMGWAHSWKMFLKVSAYVRSDDQEPSALQQGMAHLPKPEKGSYELAVDQALAKAFNIKKANLQWLSQLVTDLRARKVCLKEDEVPEDPTKTEA